MNDLISIVIPVYNAYEYVDSCIKSILNQTYQNFEILLIDDGSTDGSEKICDELSDAYENVYVIHQTNKKQGAARNVGVKQSRGKYVCFIDIDDIIAPDYLEVLFEQLCKNNADMAVCGYVEFVKDYCFANKKFSTRILEGQDRAFELLTSRKIAVAPWAKLINKKILEENPFPENVINEDTFVIYDLVIHSNRIVMIDDYIGYAYRHNENSTMHKRFTKERFFGITAKLHQLERVKVTYPCLAKYAESQLIAMCNSCVMDIGNTSKVYVNQIRYIQKLYRKFGKSYLLNRYTSIIGKIFTIGCICNLRFIIASLSILRNTR